MHFNSNTTNGKSITELYIAAAKRKEILNKRDPTVLMKSVEANQHAFIHDWGLSPTYCPTTTDPTAAFWL